MLTEAQCYDAQRSGMLHWNHPAWLDLVHLGEAPRIAAATKVRTCTTGDRRGRQGGNVAYKALTLVLGLIALHPAALHSCINVRGLEDHKIPLGYHVVPKARARVRDDDPPGSCIDCPLSVRG